MKLSNTYVVLDIETTIGKYMGRKASPFSPDNWTVAAGWKFGSGAVQSAYYGEDKQGTKGLLKMILAGGPKLLGGFNIKFDLLHLLKEPEDYEAYQDWVASGGLVWDGQLAEYLLSGMVQEAHMLSLAEVAPRYGGDTKIDEVKALWEKGVDTHLIPRQLLMDYLTGRDGKGGDILNTEAIMLGQLKAARELHMMNSIRLNMGALLASVEMERNGLWVNKPLGLELAAKLTEDIAALRAGMQQYIPADLPFDFNWGSPKQRSAIIFGGSIKYTAQEPVLDEKGEQAYCLDTQEHVVLANGGTRQTLMWEHLNQYPDGTDNEAVYYAGGQKKGQPKTKRVTVPDKSRPKFRNADFYYSFPGYTKGRKEWEGSEPGVYSTKADVIEELAQADAIERQRRKAAVQQGTPSIKPGGVPKVQPGQTPQAQVPADPIAVGEQGSGGGQHVRAMRQAGSDGLPRGGADDNELRSTGPRPSDGDDSGSPVSHMQPSNRDAGGHQGEPGAGSGVPDEEDLGLFGTLAKLGAAVKDLGTYYQTPDPKNGGAFKGMLTLVGPDGIVHHSVNHTSTVTGRLSHNNPNMGNLPKESTSEVKRMFGSRFGDDGSMASSDFKTLEIYCQAMLTGDRQLIADLVAGLDMHCARLSTVENMPYEKVLLLCKGGIDPTTQERIHAVHEWDVKRTDIKVFSFQRAYGAGAKKIAAGIKKPVEMVQEWIDADERRYPQIAQWNEKVARVVEASRVPTPVWVQHPLIKVRVQLHRGQYRTFDGKRYTFTESTTPDFLAKKGTLQSFKPTELKNYCVQGLGGEWMKAAMWLAVRAFYHYRKVLGGLAFLVNTVHDALYVDTHNSVRRKAAVLMHASMLGASDLIEYLFGTKVPVPVPSDTGYGPSMYEEHSFDNPDAFNSSAEATRTWLRAQFMEGFTPSYLKESV